MTFDHGQEMTLTLNEVCAIYSPGGHPGHVTRPLRYKTGVSLEMFEKKITFTSALEV